MGAHPSAEPPPGAAPGGAVATRGPPQRAHKERPTPPSRSPAALAKWLFCFVRNQTAKGTPRYGRVRRLVSLSSAPSINPRGTARPSQPPSGPEIPQPAARGSGAGAGGTAGGSPGLGRARQPRTYRGGQAPLRPVLPRTGASASAQRGRGSRGWGGGKDSVNHRNARSHPKATRAPAPLTEPRRALRGRGRAPFPRRTAAPRAFYKAQRHARCLSKHEKNRNGTVRNRNGNASGNAFRTTAAAPAPRSPSPHSSAAVPSAPARHCRARCAPRKRHPAVPARGPHSPCAPRAAGAALCTQHSGAAAAGR